MKFWKKVFSRYNIVSYILIVMTIALVFQLATLTIVQGDYYRDLSDNKRVKEVYTTAPRGEIRDRYGRLLAGNIPSFTVQLLKDEINLRDRALRNQHLVRLIRLLEEDGARYSNDFPLELNVFKYNNTFMYKENEITPLEKIMDIVIDNDLLLEILGRRFIKPYSDHFQYNIVNRAVDALEDREIYPKERDEFEDESSYIRHIHQLINNDKNIIRKLLDHPIARKLTYDVISGLGLEDDLKLDPYSITFQDEYIAQKTSLMMSFDFITYNSTARNDFINLVKEVALTSLLNRVIVIDEATNELFIPGEYLIQLIKNQGENPVAEVSLREDSNDIIYKMAEVEQVNGDDPLESLIIQGERLGVINDFITSDKIKFYAQSQLIQNGINPRISVTGEIEYVHINNLRTFQTANNIESMDDLESAIKSIRTRYTIADDLSIYEARSILGLVNQINSQGHLAYQPINIAYGIKDITVAKIAEDLSGIPGINISVEPVRYYPEGTSAAHILGYLGKISQNNEISKYIGEHGYSPSALIGKTGIEESYELELSGRSGVKKVEVDVVGNTTNVLEEIKPVPGNNIYLSIDLKLQQVAEEAMSHTLEQLTVGGIYRSPWGDYQFGIHNRKRRPYINATSGAVVVLDVKTGETLAMVSYPSYDPNLFSTGISNSDWLSLFPEEENNPLAPRPLYNIATQTAIQPGSTFKMVTGLAALEKGLNPLLRIRDMGFVTVGDRRFHCLIFTNTGGTHGYENLYEAIRDSCNYYFYTLAIGRNQRTNENIGVKIEIEDIVDISKKLGLNDKTGIEINVPAEVSGGVPDPQRKIITTKFLLKQLLNRTIREYIMEDKVISEEEIVEIIDEIISWTEYETPLTRAEVVRRLIAFGIEPEMRLPGEREGLADKIKYTYLNQAGWNIADTLNVTIGQGQSAYTPIQMANYIATISNGGYHNKVTLIDSIRDYNNVALLYEHEVDNQLIELNNYENLEHIKKGMQMVADDGTARRVFANFPVDVGVKTGTAERSGINPSTGDTYDDFAWFVGFAPYDDPEIAVAAVIFQGGTGGYAAPMVRDIIAEYLGLNSVEVQNPLPMESTLILD